MFGLFSKKEVKTVTNGRQLTKDYASALKELKRLRVEHCQANGMSLSDMGKDLAHIERRAKQFYSFTVSYLKSGHTHDEAYQEMLDHHISTDTDRLILEKLFLKRKES
ncbi:MULTISPECIES: hypothetical protein [unclassified Fusibacter]|uniref:hypothetical protein n=1 Tax=unclassified Fusibacter TaxID=2624464 RepID=UPI00101128C5|nr:MULTISPECIES: hypothetical protein [unclassified Fusibacter]MCK8059641.1 hypothetical protein [Fusibacter sp. A2]NPE21442.1 hypothetical protein [Fusibacter sp. A1]RXV61854.1 hypothetical protein DWB64_06350 [Fusibacter sp. A1]